MIFKPKVNADTELFLEGCKNQKLLFQQCEKCKKVIWPYSYACPDCLSVNFQTVKSNGIGSIYAFTILNVSFHKSFKDKIPYVVAIVELFEGPKILTNIVETPFEFIKCGAEVKVLWEKAGDTFIHKFTICRDK